MPFSGHTQGQRIETPISWVIKRLLSPFIVVVSLFIITSVYGENIDKPYISLAILGFFLSFKIFYHLEVFETHQQMSPGMHIRDLTGSWLMIIGILLLTGFLLGVTEQFSRTVLITWFISTPILLALAHLLVRQWLFAERSQAHLRSVVIVGGNALGDRLGKAIRDNPYLLMSVKGYFDDRALSRLEIEDSAPLLGEINDLPEYAKQQAINVIYITLPMTAQPRIMRLLDQLNDTTASIYFVPDIFVYDLVQARFAEVGNVPVVAICETPFLGVNGVIKRITDLTIASVAMLLLLPVFLIIGLSIKLTSPGPVFFKQRRYGQNGEEIRVWKFRSMTTCEDGAQVQQAQKNDARITKIGGFLRRSSLDELPQLINVILGEMSLVGPRPHAVAHNELYRSLIQGYMIRHKVKPGITGLAQVNNLRGETDTLEKMQKRIEYDIDYLRRWSPALDLWIIYRTIFVVAGGENAY